MDRFGLENLRFALNLHSVGTDFTELRAWIMYIVVGMQHGDTNFQSKHMGIDDK